MMREKWYSKGSVLIYLIAIWFCNSTNEGHATVLEYDKNGKVDVIEAAIVTNTKSTRKSQTDTRTNKKYRTLTREIALRFSGSIGVRKAGLDAFTFVEIFEALIQRESGFDPLAISPKGAQGLGQLRPDTAADMGVANPFDPESNLVGSAKYFTIQLAEFGSLDLALAAYNAGPGRVNKYQGIPPFKETKDYIASIKKAAGLTEQQQTLPVSAPVRPASAPVKKEQPLTGETSVWEF